MSENENKCEPEFACATHGRCWTHSSEDGRQQYLRARGFYWVRVSPRTEYDLPAYETVAEWGDAWETPEGWLFAGNEVPYEEDRISITVLEGPLLSPADRLKQKAQDIIANARCPLCLQRYKHEPHKPSCPRRFELCVHDILRANCKECS